MSDEREDREDRPERREIKVTDKRMFTPEGELREEYRETARAEPAEPEAPGGPAREGQGPAAPPGGAPAPDAQPPPPAGAAPGAPEGAEGTRRPPLELPDTGPGPQPSFLDLLGILAEPAAIYLGDAELPDGSRAENLDAARLYIDLLDVLRRKTAGNLTAQESSVLEDVLYRLRMRYVQKQG